MNTRITNTNIVIDIAHTGVARILSPDVVAKIRQIEIHTKRALKSVVPGGRRSRTKGRGFDFDQIREYQLGDDVRCIDWSGSARTGTLLVRQYKQESSRTILLVADVSSSLFFSSGIERTYDTITRVAAVLSFVADYSGDAIGLLLFSDQEEYYIAPEKGKAQVNVIIRALFTYTPKGKKTSFDSACKKIMGLVRKNMIVVCISDFVCALDSPYVRAVASCHALVAIRCLDIREHVFPDVGFVSIVDPETGELVTLDTRASGTMHALLQERLREQNAVFTRYKIPVLDVTNDTPFINEMVRFFKRNGSS